MVVLKLDHILESSAELVKTQVTSCIPRVSDAVSQVGPKTLPFFFFFLVALMACRSSRAKD